MAPVARSPATTTNRPAKNTRIDQSTRSKIRRGGTRAVTINSAAAASAEPGSGCPPSASPRNSASAARPLAVSTRSNAGLGGARSTSGPVGSCLRNIHTSTAALPARHATPIGSINARYAAKPGSPAAARPMIMFCGLPLQLTTPPRFDADASARRYGKTGSRASTATATTSGVSSRHTVSLSKSADIAPAVKVSPHRSDRAERAPVSTRYAL